MAEETEEQILTTLRELLREIKYMRDKIDMIERETEDIRDSGRGYRRQ